MTRTGVFDAVFMGLRPTKANENHSQELEQYIYSVGDGEVFGAVEKLRPRGCLTRSVHTDR